MFLVQDETSMSLLNKIKIRQVKVIGIQDMIEYLIYLKNLKI